MDEISYWIYTKRAPCLFSYDSATDKDGTGVFYPIDKSFHSNADEPPPPDKKKRKLSLLDDESLSTVERQQNLYFDVSQTKVPHLTERECRSHSAGSHIDFNVKKNSKHNKRKPKLHKPSRTRLHKKNKVITSTPNTTTLRRSPRKVQNGLSNNSQINNSYEDLNYNARCNVRSQLEKVPEDKLKPIELDTGDHLHVSTRHHRDRVTKGTIVANDQYEGLSDVSGFTANYIRSTKIHSGKTQRKLKSKVANRNLMRESRHSAVREESRMIVCVNKAVNTGLPQAMLDCSTDSSQYVLNSVTVTHNDRSRKVDKCISQLKFIVPKNNNNISATSDVLDTSKNIIDNANISFPSSTSRYPKRHKNVHTNSLVMITDKINSSNAVILSRQRKASKNSLHYNSSDRKENPSEKVVSKTRSGRNIGLTIRQPENSVLVLSNSAEQVSSRASINVASPQVDHQCDNRKQRKRMSARQLEMKKSMDDHQSPPRGSLRDKSGFAACFSDSDDSEPLKQKKFFC